jgi:hypothetical protein
VFRAVLVWNLKEIYAEFVASGCGSGTNSGICWIMRDSTRSSGTPPKETNAMRLKQLLYGIVLSAPLIAGAALAAAAADAPAEPMPVAAPEAAAEADATAADEATPTADEGIPADASTAAEDADTVVEGEEPKK